MHIGHFSITRQPVGAEKIGIDTDNQSIGHSIGIGQGVVFVHHFITRAQLALYLDIIHNRDSAFLCLNTSRSETKQYGRSQRSFNQIFHCSIPV